MIELPLHYWIAIAVGVALLLIAATLLFTRRRHVEIAPPEIADTPVAPTLVRHKADIPLVVPTAVAEPSIAVLAADEQTDDLSRMKGVGPKLVMRLHALGIRRYDQIAAWTEADMAAVDAQLGAFAGRAARDRWIEQARLLAANDLVGYEGSFGKIEPTPGESAA